MIGNGAGQTIQEGSHRAKNWRHLITPAHDSFKKLEKSRRPGVQYSHQQRDQMTNQGSTGQINLNDQVSQARPLIFTSQHTHTHSLEEMTAPISLKHERDDSKSGGTSLMSVKEFNTPAMILTQEAAHSSDAESFNEEKSIASMRQSLLKSQANIENADFYEDLHRKYFNKAKERDQRKGQP